MTNIDYYKHPYSLAEVIGKLNQFSKDQDILNKLDEESPEYFRKLIQCLPLRRNSAVPSKSVPIPGSKHSEDYTEIYRNGEFSERLVTCLHPSVNTGYHLFKKAVQMYPDNDCFGARIFLDGSFDKNYSWFSYSQVDTIIHDIGSGLMNLVNLKRGKSTLDNDFVVALWAPNRREWTMTDLACQAYSLVNTALYDTLGPKSSSFILNKTSCCVVVCSKDKIVKLLSMQHEVPTLTTIVSMDDLTDSEKNGLQAMIPKTSNMAPNVSILSLNELMKMGKMSPVEPIPPVPQTPYTISFTSGTTGEPKGVVLNHLQFSSAVCFSLSNQEKAPLYGAKQMYYLSVLPLAHIFERGITGVNLMYGSGIGYLHKPTPDALLEDLKILEPHMFGGVPRIYSKFESGLRSVLSETTGVKKKLVDGIIASRAASLAKTTTKDISIVNKLHHKILIDKARKGLGLARCEFFITGSAPISQDTVRFLRSVLDIGVKQGYGLTESFSGMCCSDPYEAVGGSCGPNGVTTEMRLKSIPSMGYYAANREGELQLRGPHIFEGYFKNPEETKKCLGQDGWLSTGDVARIDKEGRIYIIDRVKNFFKLAQGEYIAPERIENAYLSSSSLLTQLFIYGDSLKSFLVAIAGIDTESVRKFLLKMYPEVEHYSSEHLVNFINEQSVKSHVLRAINKSVVSSGLQGVEKIHNIQFFVEPLKVSQHTITPTLKVRRANASNFFSSQCKALYEEGSLLRSKL